MHVHAFGSTLVCLFSSGGEAGADGLSFVHDRSGDAGGGRSFFLKAHVFVEGKLCFQASALNPGENVHDLESDCPADTMTNRLQMSNMRKS